MLIKLIFAQTMWVPKKKKTEEGSDEEYVVYVAGGCVIAHGVEKGTRKVVEISRQSLCCGVYWKRQGLLLVGGEDRNIHGVDIETSSIVARWPNATQLIVCFHRLLE